MADELIVKQCAPALAGIKTGNLFPVDYTTEEALWSEIRRMNHRLLPKGLRMILVRCENHRALIYLYRPCRLRGDIADREAQRILKANGYDCSCAEKCVFHLTQRLRQGGSFPHEIGLFLSYPPEDVRGFIEHRDEGCKCVGCWKVYGDVEKAQSTFSHYKKCTEDYCKKLADGVSVEQLAVAI